MKIEFGNDGSTEIKIPNPNEVVSKPERNYKFAVNEFLQIGFLSKEEDFPLDEIGSFFKVYRVIVRGCFGRPTRKRILLIPKDWYKVEENNISELYTIEYLQKMLKEFDNRYVRFTNISAHFDIYLGWYKVIEEI